MGALIFGFQNPGLSNGDIHDLSTRQVNPLVPLAAVSYPCGLRASMVALSEIAAGAALRASAISARSGMRYCSRRAILSQGAAPFEPPPGAGGSAAETPASVHSTAPRARAPAHRPACLVFMHTLPLGLSILATPAHWSVFPNTRPTKRRARPWMRRTLMRRRSQGQPGPRVLCHIEARRNLRRGTS